MTLKNFIEQKKQNLEHFNKDYSAHAGEQDWPNEMNYADWCEQLAIWEDCNGTENA